MLMEIPFEERLTFLSRVMRDAKPAFHLTQAGDPTAMANFKRFQPNYYTAWKLETAPLSEGDPHA